MADVYFKGMNIGTLENSAIKRLKGEKLKIDVRNGAAILSSADD